MILLASMLACAGKGAVPLDTALDEDTPPSSVEVGQVIVTELMSDPAVVDGDFGEWIELRNVSDAAIDLQGVVLQDGDDAGFAVEGALTVAAGGHVVLGPQADEATNGGVPIDYAYSVDAVKLGNEGDTLTLLANGEELDRFAWDAEVLIVEEGAALQLDVGVTTPEGNDDVAAWCLATGTYGAGDRGTPGQANAACEPGT